MRRLFQALTVLAVAATAALVAAAPAQAATICEQYGTTTIQDTYIVQNNRWGSAAEQCIDTTDNGFRITSQQGSTSTSGPPLSYPSVVLGCHYQNCSPGTNLPAQLSQVSSVPSAISYGYAGGTYNATYDIWMDPTPKTDGVSQMEIMIWFHRQGSIQPIGGPVGNTTVGGRNWEVWQGNNGGNDVVSYLAPTTINSWSFNVKDFIDDVVARTQVTNDWYLTSLQAGFEPWNGGVGLAVNTFSAEVNVGTSPPPPPPPGDGGTIAGQASGRCLDILDLGTADSTPIQLWDCTANWNQLWSRTGNTFVNPQTGKCLDVSGGSTTNGARVQLYTCNGTGAQSWQVNGDGTITNPQSGKCLDAVEQGTGNGTRLQIWDCFGGGGTQPNQVWTVGGGSTPPPPGDDQTPLAINGQLYVCGVNLCNQYHQPIQLRGMSTHGLQWFNNCYNDASLDVLADEWRADLFRIAMYVQEGGYETNPPWFTNRVNELVDEAEERGLYAMIDFHTLTPGDPMYNLDRAKTFFAAVASRNADKKNVIYEIANEPNGVGWGTIKSYAEQVIPVIRANDPDAVIIVGTRGWSSLGVSEGSNADEVINNPVNASNIMYAFHFYAASHQDFYRTEVQRAAATLPLFVTEFGTVDYTGDGGVDVGSTNAWLNLLDQLKIGYANWTYSDANEGSGAFNPGTCNSGNFSGTSNLTASGNLLRSRISTPDNFPTS